MIDETLRKEAKEFLEDARAQKKLWEPNLREGYLFAAPMRHRLMDSQSPVTTPPKDAGQVSTSFGMEMAEDFSTIVMNTFLQQSEKWCKRQPGASVPPEIRDQVAGQIEDGDEAIFTEILSSHFYDECTKAFTPDLALGTVAMWIDPGTVSTGTICQAVPLHELETTLGPHGELDARFHVRHTRYRYLKVLIPGVPLPAKIQDMVQKKPMERVELRRGFWRLWERQDDICWQYVVMIGNDLVKAEEITGRGSCPLIVARFGAMQEWAFGFGPLLKAMPDLRQIDEMSVAKIESLDFALRPPVSIPDDSAANFEDGIESGHAYPIRPGSEGAIKPIYVAPSPQVGIFDMQAQETRIKRLFFLDFPEQRGDTPPSATQWLDEMAKAQRRIGMPGLVFWREFCAEVFLRFQFMLEKRGVIKPVEVDGKMVSVVPYNPAQRAAEQQEVSQAARFIELGGQAFPEEFKASIDGTETLRKLIKKMGADKIVSFRKPEAIQAAVQLIQKLSGGQAGSAPQAATAGPEGPPTPAVGAPTATPLQPSLRITR